MIFEKREIMLAVQQPPAPAQRQQAESRSKWLWAFPAVGSLSMTGVYVSLLVFSLTDSSKDPSIQKVHAVAEPALEGLAIAAAANMAASVVWTSGEAIYQAAKSSVGEGCKSFLKTFATSTWKDPLASPGAVIKNTFAATILGPLYSCVHDNLTADPNA